MPLAHCRSRGKPVSEVGGDNPLCHLKQEGMEGHAPMAVRWGPLKLGLPNTSGKQESPGRKTDTREGLPHAFPHHIRVEGMAVSIEVKVGKTVKDLSSRSV